MTDSWRRGVELLLLLAAIAWPLDLLQYVPGLGITLLGVIAILLVPPLIQDALAQQKLRVPFEILAPVFILVALTGIASTMGGRPGTMVEVVAAAILLVALTHFAPSPEVIRQYLFASVISGFAVTLWTLFARLLDYMPTAFSLQSGVTFTFARSVASGIHILVLIGAVAIYVARDRRYAPPQRAAATGTFIFVACALVGAAVQWFWDTRSYPVSVYPDMGWFEIGASVAAAWLVARILGKVAARARVERDRLFSLWFAVGAFTLLVCAFAPVPPGAYQGFIAGLACASVVPARLDARFTRADAAVALLPLALAMINLATVFPGNPRDQRQYDAAARRDFETGNYTRLLTRMDTIQRHAAGERRTHLWRARTALALGLPNWASFEFAQAVGEPAGRLLLSPPTEAERKDFVVQMRDLVAEMPEARSICAFERTLLAQGERDAALYSLRLETAVPLTSLGATDAEPFAGAVATIVGDPAVVEDLATWSADELVTLLTYWGAELDGAEDAEAVFVLAAQRTTRGVDIFIHYAGVAAILHADLPPPGSGVTTPAGPRRLRWIAQPDAPHLEFALVVEDPKGVWEAGRLEFSARGTPSFQATDMLPAIPFTPAILLRAGP